MLVLLTLITHISWRPASCCSFSLLHVHGYTCNFGDDSAHTYQAALLNTADYCELFAELILELLLANLSRGITDYCENLP